MNFRQLNETTDVIDEKEGRHRDKFLILILPTILLMSVTHGG